MAEAKNIVKNKFWVIEEDGHQVGTIQAVNDGVVLVTGQTREKFPSLKLLTTKHNMHVARRINQKSTSVNSVYDYPCDAKPYNSIYDLKSRLPLYTKESKSKSFYCAGYYLVDFNGTWLTYFCPKKIVLSRNKFFGPFINLDDLNLKLSQIKS